MKQYWEKTRGYLCPNCGRSSLWHLKNVTTAGTGYAEDVGTSSGNYYCIRCREAFLIADENDMVWLPDNARLEIEKYANNLKCNKK